MKRIGSLVLSAAVLAALFCSLLPIAALAEVPVISEVTASGVTDNSAAITWKTNISANGNVEYDIDSGVPYANSLAQSNPNGTSHLATLVGLSSKTTYYYRVKSADGLDEATSSESSFTTKAFAISDVTFYNITATSATITWSTSVAATGNVAYGTSTGYGSAAPVPADTTHDDDTTTHIVTLSGLSAGTLYHYQVRSKDASDNEELSEDFTFTTAPDIVAPVISVVASSEVTYHGAKIAWNTDETANSRVAYSTATRVAGDPYANLAALLAAYSSSTVEDPTLVGSHTVALGGLTPTTTYYYRAISRDAAGNEAWSGEYSFTTGADTVAPVISSVAFSGITSGGANITWSTDEAATSRVAYSTATQAAGDPYANLAALLAAYSSSTAEDVSLVVPHTVALSGLNPTTTYYYRAISRDAYDNWAWSSEYSFTTTADITPPVISGVASAATTISWSTNELATAQVAYSTTSHAGDPLYANIAALLTAYGSSSAKDATLDTSQVIVLFGLTPSTPYYYRVLSVDASGNEAWSGEYSLTTAADTTSPVISGVANDGPTVNWDTNETATSQVAYSTTSYASDTFTSIVELLATYGTGTPEDSTLVLDHSVTLTGISPATTYYYRVISKDAAVNKAWTGEYSFTTTADVTPPVISGVASVATTISWSTNELATAQVAYSTTAHAGPFANIAALLTAYGSSSPVDATPDTSQVIVLTGLSPNTPYYYRALSVDASGNQAWSDEYSLTTAADTTSPVISGVANTGPTVDWDTNEPATSQVAYSTVSYASDTFTSIVALLATYGTGTPEDSTLVLDHSVTLTGISPDTTYYYRVISKDAAVNKAWTGEYSFTTTADVTPPVISGVASAATTISWSTNELATAQVAYDTTSHAGDPPYANIAALLTAYGSSSAKDVGLDTSQVIVLFGLTPNTPYYYRVLSVDASGNQAWSDEYSLTTAADTTPPVISNVAQVGPTVTWDTSEPATSQVAYSTTSYASDTFTSIVALLATYGANSPEDPTLVLAHSVTLSGLNPATTYYYRVISKDAAVNKAWSGEYSFTTTADTTPPLISAVAPSGVSDTGAGITWSTNELATSQVAYSITSHSTDSFVGVNALLAAYGSGSAEDATPVLTHSVSITGLSVSTTYYYRVISRDASGNESWSAESPFTTAADLVPPIISNISPTDGVTVGTTTTATITWSTNELATSNVEYGLTTAYGSPAPTPTDASADKTSHTVVLTGLTPNTAYHYKVKSKDASNNEATSVDRTFTTSADVNAPVISAVAPSGAIATATTATITWSTNELATSNVEYGLTTAYGSPAPTPTDASADKTSHTVVLTGLTPNTAYHYKVKSKDASNNEATSADLTFTTSPDITPPTISSVAASGVTVSTATITWSTNELATSNVQYGTTTAYGSAAPTLADTTADNTSHSVVLTGLAPNTTYHYKVKSRDAAVNEATSADLTFTTLADTALPTISAVTASDITTTTATIAWATNELATSNVEYGTTTAYGSNTPTPADTSADTLSHSVVLTGLTPGTAYHCRVKSRDASNNEAASADYSFSTLSAQMDVATLVVATFTAETPTVVDALAQSGVKVTFSGTGPVTGTVQIAKYTAAPTIPTVVFKTGTGKEPVKYVDVQVSGFTTGTATITVQYTDAEIAGLLETKLALYYWEGTSWKPATNISVDAANNTVAGDIPVSALGGTPVAIGGSKPAGFNFVLIGGIVGGVVVILVVVYFLVIRKKKSA